MAEVRIAGLLGAPLAAGSGLKTPTAVENKVLAIIHLYVEPNKLLRVAETLKEMPEILDVYEVTGDYDIIAIVASDNINQLRELLKDKVLKTEGIKSSVTTIVLQTHKRS